MCGDMNVFDTWNSSHIRQRIHSRKELLKCDECGKAFNHTSVRSIKKLTL